MNLKFVSALALTAGAAGFGGYMMAHSTPLKAEPGVPAGSMILSTTQGAGGQDIVYILKTEPTEDATLMVYSTTGKGDLELQSVRRISYDVKVYDMGGKGNNVETIKKAVEKK